MAALIELLRWTILRAKATDQREREREKCQFYYVYGEKKRHHVHLFDLKCIMMI